MKANWEQTQFNDKVAIQNYYSPQDKQMALVMITSPYAGVLANFWCPILERDIVAERALKLADKLYGTVSVCHPLPNVDDAPQPLFERYIFHSWD